MSKSNGLVWKAYVGLIGAVTGLAVTKLIEAGWRRVTGAEPPRIDDPEVSTRRALVWATTSAASVAVASVLATRLAARGWQRMTGAPAPSELN